ncbi:MAG TPA: hypothetical protein VJ962_12765 [Clostridia bacterium]|nr:hypothetical protein [Clostridia bacterium]
MLSQKDLKSSVKELIDDWDNQIQGLQRGIHKINGDVKDEYNKRIDELKEQRNALQEEVHSIQKASDKGLKEIEEGLEVAKDSFNETMEKINNLFNNK